MLVAAAAMGNTDLVSVAPSRPAPTSASAPPPSPGPAAPAPSSEHVPLRVKVAYGAPSFAGAAMAIPIAIHLSIFYSDTILLPLGVVALVKALARALDAFTDPVMGWLTDRTRTRWGRRRPWMLLGAPLAALAFFAMFAPPEGLGPRAAAGWFAVSYTLYYLFHTVYQIPHYGLGPEITQNYKGRASLYGWSEGFSVLGTLVAAFLPPLMVALCGGDERMGFAAFAAVFGVLLTLLYVNLVLQVRERPDFVNRRPNPLIPGVRRVMRNRVFRLLLAIYLIGAVTGAIPGTMMPYFTKYVIRPESEQLYQFWLMVFLGVYFGAAVVFMPVWVWAAKRYGKRPVWIFSFLSSVLGLLAIFFLVGKDTYAAFVAILVWTGSTFSARLLLGPAMQADVIDYDELYTGKRREAQYGGLWSIMTKFTVIPSMSVPLAVMASLGYEPNVAQSETVQLAIRAIFALAPAATALLALVLAIGYPMTEAVHARVLEGIECHRRGQEAVDPLSDQVVPPPVEDGEDDDTAWFLDHFSPRELRRHLAGGEPVRGPLLASLASLVVCAGGVLATASTVNDVTREPGLMAVLEILVAGLGFTALCYHALRLRAAVRLRARPVSPEVVRAHVAGARIYRDPEAAAAALATSGD